MDNNTKRTITALRDACKEMVENYAEIPEKNMFYFEIAGNPFNIKFDLRLQEENSMVVVLSQLGFFVPDERKLEYLVEINNINFNELALGSYDFCLDDGATVYRYSYYYRDNLTSKENIKQVCKIVYDTVSSYNERLFKVACKASGDMTGEGVGGASDVETVDIPEDVQIDANNKDTSEVSPN